ncbi:MAG: small multi-drug export protein [Lachnospiraceae bacterium]|nr:small multi-drug export protein [Lachnospiraceae bacterium]
MKYLIIFLIAMLPLVELRVAVPTGLAMGLPVLSVYIVSILGNMLPVPFIYFFARKVLEWGKDKRFIGRFFTFCCKYRQLSAHCTVF